MNFVPIQKRDRAKQLVSFEGMEVGENMWPTDIDAIIEWKDSAWIMYEVKHGKAPFPTGQRLVLERFVHDEWKAGKPAVAVVVEHQVDDPEEDVRLAQCPVRLVYWGGEFVWREPYRPMKAGELNGEYIRFVERLSA